MKRQLVSIFLFTLCFLPAKSQSLLTNNTTILEDEVQSIIKTTEENIFNPYFMETQAWKNFKQEITSEKALKLNTTAFVDLFNREVKNLPFTHYRLLIQPSSKKETGTKPEAFDLKELNSETALLTIRVFSSDAKKMIQIIDTLQKSTYKNLIIDLRNNPGGTLDAAVPLVQYLSSSMMHGGYFISRAWFTNHKDYPTLQQLQLFTPLQDPSYQGFTKKMKKGIGMSLLIPPSGKPTFKGSLFVLTNKGTGSACEPFVFGIKHNKLGVIVGEKTAGAMLSGYELPISKNLKLFMPLADYVTVTNQRLDKVGVEPDITIKSEQALDYVLKNLIQE